MIAIRSIMYFSIALAVAGNLIAADPFVGRWKLDVRESKTMPDNPNEPRPKQVTLVCRDSAESREVAVQGINADGSPIKGGFSIPINGGPGKVMDSNDAYDGITMKYISPTIHDLIYTKGDRDVARRHVVMSQDGRTMTTTYKGANPQGMPITRVEVWHKQ